LIDPLEDMDVSNQLFEVLPLLQVSLNLIKLQHQQIIFQSNRYILLLITVGHRFLVRFLSEINQSVNKADFDLF